MKKIFTKFFWSKNLLKNRSFREIPVSGKEEARPVEGIIQKDRGKSHANCIAWINLAEIKTIH